MNCNALRAAITCHSRTSPLNTPVVTEGSRMRRGACAAVITGEIAEAMGAASKQHVMQMLQAGDAAQVRLRAAQRVR